MNDEERLEPVLRHLFYWSLIITVAISGLSLIGWASGSTILTSVKQYYIPIAPSTVLCLLILSISFLISIIIPNILLRMITACCASLTIVIASIFLISFFMGITIEAERLWFARLHFQTPYQSGHMSPVSAIMFIVASLGILLLCLPGQRKQLYKNVASFMALSVGSAGFIIVIGYLHGTPLLYGGTFIPVAFQTALAFVFLGLGIIFASGSSSPPVRLFAGSSVRSLLMRTFLPTSVGFVLLSDVVDAIALSSAANPALTLSLSAITSAVVVGIIVTKIAKSVGRKIDQANKERDEKAIALRESEERYRELSIVDDLTQLFNSRHFYHQLKIEVDRANRYEQPLTLLLLDLDNFKAFNDAYGHVEGDQVLLRLGQVVKRCLRQTDSAYRYGGEEFTILLPMTTNVDGAVTAERIRVEFKKETFSPAPGQDVHVTVSIGVAQYRTQEEMKAFVHRVDQFMYQGKKNGKDKVCSES